MKFDRLYLFIAFAYAIAGMLLGIMMAASQNHAQHVTHAHLLLVGFMLSFVYAVTHRLWLGGARGILAQVQFGLHQAGALVMVVGLYLFYGGRAPIETLQPVLAGASVAVLLGVVLMVALAVAARGGAPASRAAPAVEEA